MRLTKQQAADQKYRNRNWQTILYPDSAPEDWSERIAESGVQVLVSPCHDKDINGDGSPKKAHYHIIVMFHNKKAFWQVDELFEHWGALHGFASDGKSAFLPVDDLRISVRYLTHLDNPEKHQYREEDVLSFGGADFASLATLPSDDDVIMGEILQWLNDYKVFSYRQLIMYARDNERSWFRFLNHKGSRHVYQVMKSSLWEFEKYGELVKNPTIFEKEGRFFDRKTGEEVQIDED